MAAKHRTTNRVNKLNEPLAARAPVVKTRESSVRKELLPDRSHKR